MWIKAADDVTWHFVENISGDKCSCGFIMPPPNNRCESTEYPTGSRCFSCWQTFRGINPTPPSANTKSPKASNTSSRPHQTPASTQNCPICAVKLRSKNLERHLKICKKKGEREVEIGEKSEEQEKYRMHIRAIVKAAEEQQKKTDQRIKQKREYEASLPNIDVLDIAWSGGGFETNRRRH